MNNIETVRESPYRNRRKSLPGFVLYRGVHPIGTELPRHTHEDPTLCYVLRGRFTEYVAGTAVDCVSDTLKVTPAGEKHWNRFSAEETHGLRIDVERARFADSPAIERMLDERMLVPGGRSHDIVHRLIVELDERDDASAIAAEGLLLELLAAIARESGPSRAAEIPPWLRRADDMIRDLYTSQIGLARVADAVGVAPATLSRGYRSAFRITIGERIRQLRIERSARDLLATEMSLSSVALSAGFYDQSHFTNMFRRTFGVTPAQYRAAGNIRRGSA